MASDSFRFILQQAETYPVVTAVVSATIIATLTMSPGRLLGYAQTKYYHSSETLQVQTKSGSTTSFADFCKSVVPTCRLSPFLFNGHLQTIWTALKGQHIPIYYKRKIFENEDPTYTGQFTVDFVTAPNDASDPELPPRTTYFTDDEFDKIGSLDRRPMLVVLHGLKGGSHEIYVRHVLRPLVGAGGWEACVVNSRGCSQSKVTTSILYNARATWDIRQTVKWLKETYPNRPLFGIGFSLGANIITNVGGLLKSGSLLLIYIAPLSTLPRRARIVCSKQLSSCQVPGISMLETWLYKGHGSGEMCIPKHWAKA